MILADHTFGGNVKVESRLKTQTGSIGGELNDSVLHALELYATMTNSTAD